jgi:hypothetical protein
LRHRGWQRERHPPRAAMAQATAMPQRQGREQASAGIEQVRPV